MKTININYSSCQDAISEIKKCIDKIKSQIKYMERAIQELSLVSNKYREKNQIISDLNRQLRKINEEINRLKGLEKGLSLYIEELRNADKSLSKIV